jgi:DNA-binding beta-propeller fold protein YncE
MNWKRLFTIFLPILLVMPAVMIDSQAFAAVEWDLRRSIEIEAIPIDVALSPDGRRLFVLTDQGSILVYSTKNTPSDKIYVGNHVDQIKIGPSGDVLILSSRKDKKVQIVTLDFIQNINISGSPFKGAADAPVVIAVFDDFQ